MAAFRLFDDLPDLAPASRAAGGAGLFDDLPDLTEMRSSAPARPDGMQVIGDGLNRVATLGREVREFGKGILPGAVQMGGTALKGGAGIQKAGQYNAADFGVAQIAIMDRIDAGEDVPDADDALGYQYMNPEQRQAARAQAEKAAAAFNPGTVEGSNLFQAGESVETFGREMFPVAPGMEDSTGRAIGEGVGSVVTGALTSLFTGPVGAGALFAVTGAGESVDRAVKAGATEAQIVEAAQLGIIPGLTDSVPIETLLGRIPVPGVGFIKIPPDALGTVMKAIGRVGYQAFIEAVQEGSQSTLQNWIEREVYNPEQTLVEGVPEDAALGAAVGAVVESLLTPFRRRGGSTGPDAVDASPDAIQAPKPGPAGPAGLFGDIPEGAGLEGRNDEPVAPGAAADPALIDDARYLLAMGENPQDILDATPSARALLRQEAIESGIEPLTAEQAQARLPQPAAAPASRPMAGLEGLDAVRRALQPELDAQPATAQQAGMAVPPPVEDRERADSPRLTQEERDGPLPNDILDDGKDIIEKVLRGEAPVSDTTLRGDTPASQIAPETQGQSLNNRPNISQQTAAPTTDSTENIGGSVLATPKTETAANPNEFSSSPASVPENSSGRPTASWVIREKATGEVAMETFDREAVANLKTDRFEAVPIEDYLGSLNRPQSKPDQMPQAVAPQGSALAEAPAAAAPIKNTNPIILRPPAREGGSERPWLSKDDAIKSVRQKDRRLYEAVSVTGGFGLQLRTEPKASKGSRAPRTLLELAASVGLKASDPYAAEVRAIFGSGKNGRTFIPGYGNIVRTDGTGESFDRIREMAAEGGLLGEGDRAEIMARTRPAEALERMRRERNFGRQEGMTEADQLESAEAREAERVAEENERYDVAREELRTFLKEIDLSEAYLHSAVRDRAIDLIAQGEQADEAVSLATGEVLATLPLAPRIAEVSDILPPGWDNETLDRLQQRGEGSRGGSGQDARPEGQTRADPAQADAGGAVAVREGQGAVNYELGAPGARNDLQAVIPGAEQIGQGQQAQIRADAPLRPSAAQADVDGLALFSDARNQTDMFDAPAQAPQPPQPRKTSPTRPEPAEDVDAKTAWQRSTPRQRADYVRLATGKDPSAAGDTTGPHFLKWDSLDPKTRDAVQRYIDTGERSPQPAEAPAQSETPVASTLAPTPAAKIDDFGEKLEGARKDYAQKMRDAADVDIAAEPLAKSWPEPDYQQLLDNGSDPWAVAFMHAARDEVPLKPRKAWKLKSWVQQVTMLRDVTMKLTSGEIDPARARELLEGKEMRVFGDLVGRIDLYQAVGHEKSLKGVRVRAGSYSLMNGVRYDPPLVRWTVEREAKATAFSNWPQELAAGDTREAAIAAFKKGYSKIETQPQANKQVSFSIYSYRSGAKAGQFWIGKRLGKEYLDLRGFATAKEARDYLGENAAELEAELERRKEIPAERKESNSPRVGADHRNGADVTPEQFSEAFGFRGVQFGNYVEGPRRQADLNEAYDALMDLAGVIGVPARALSLNGEMGLAFGARGKGGKRPAAAHYETDRIVINLTKAKGAGSLAHEWWHGVDHYFSRQRNDKTGFLSEKPYPRGEGVRPEVVEAFKQVMQTVNQTTLQQRSRELDKRRTKAYWSTGREMSARSFESYVVAKLQDQDGSNDYLANIVSQEYWDAAAALGVAPDGGTASSYPYLTAAEIPAVRAAFDNLFNVIETRESDDGNVPMFSRRQEERSQPDLSPDRTVPVIDAKSRYKGMPPKQARLRAEMDARRDVRGKHSNNDTGWTIDVTNASVRKSLSGDMSAVRAELVANLPALIKNAVLVESHSDSRAKEPVAKVHRLYAPLRLDGRMNRVKLTVREFTDGARVHYAVDFAEIDGPGGYTAPVQGDAGSDPTTAPPDPSIEIGVLLRDVNYEDGSPVFSRRATGDDEAGDSDVLPARRQGTPFYSAVENAAEAIAQAKGTGPQWLAMLKKAPGVKAEEIDWMGLPTWLADRKSITKDEVLEYVRANQVQVEETVKGGDGVMSRDDVRPTDTAAAPFMDEWRKNIEEFRRQEEAMGQAAFGSPEHREAQNNLDRLIDKRVAIHQKMVDATIEEMGGLAKPTKYQDYTLPGGENYRELLIRMPERTEAPMQTYDLEANGVEISRSNDGRGWAVFDVGQGWLADYPTREEAERAAQDRAHQNFLLENNDVEVDRARVGEFRSSHFAEPNILAHVRFNERTGANGERVLFVEEIQSDWHQAGRKKGYNSSSSVNTDGWTVRPINQQRGLMDQQPFMLDEEGNVTDEFESFGIYDAQGNLVQEHYGDYLDDDTLINTVAQRIDRMSQGVPDAPLKKTWHETAFRRAVAWAAENGFDSVAWTTGQQQADRFDLSKRVTKIEYEKNDDGTYNLLVTGNDRSTVFDKQDMTLSEIEDTIGKEMAQKIERDEGKRSPDASAYREWKEFTGLDLRVGGEGMKGFYDKILPAYASKWGKKFGASVGKTEILAQTEAETEAQARQFYEDGMVGSLAEGREAARGDRPAEVWTMPVTDAMRESVQSDGVPLFQQGGDRPNNATDGTTTIREGAGRFAYDLSFSEKFLASRKALFADLRRQLDGFGVPDVALRISDGIELFIDGIADGNLDGVFWKGTVEVALDAENPATTVRHEFVHAAKAMGLFTKSEWKILTDRAKRDWMTLYNIADADRYGAWSEARQLEEAVAAAFEKWKGGGTATGMIERLFKRMQAFAEALGNALRGNGFNTVESIFAEMEAGNVGRRGLEGASDAGVPMASRRGGPNPNAPFETFEARSARDITRMFRSWEGMSNAKNWQDLFWLTRTTLQDDTAPILRQQRAVEAATGSRLTIAQDTVGMIERYRGISGVKLNDFHQNEMLPLLQMLRKAKIKPESLRDYLFARHVEERNKQIAKLYEVTEPNSDFVKALTDPDIAGGSGFSLNWARAEMARVQSDSRRSVFEAAAKEHDRIHAERMDREVASGLITQDEADARRKAYKFYTPMRGWEGEESAEGWGVGRGFDARGRSQRAMGRSSMADDPLAYTFMLAAQSIVKAEKQKVGNAMLRFVEANPNEDAWTVDRSESVRRIKNKIVMTVDPATGLPVAERRDVVQTERQAPSRMADNVFIVKKNGVDVAITFANRDIAATLKNLDPERMNIALQGLARVTRLMAALNTSWNVEWFVTNIARDLQAASIQISDQEMKGLGRKMLKNWPAALKGAFAHNMGNHSSNWARVAKDFEQAGGRVSYLDFKSVQELKDLINSETSDPDWWRLTKAGPKKLLDGLEVFTQAGENAIRIAAYKAALDMGMPKPRAASMARALTVDFNKRGTLSPAINAFYMFFNAAVQGNVRLAQSIMRSKFTRKALGGLVALGFLEALLGTGDDDEYEKVESWIRERNFVIMLNPLGLGEKGEYIKIPMPYGFNVFKVMGTEIGRSTLHGASAQEAAGNIFGAALNSFNPIGGQDVMAMLMPTVLDAPLETARNETFFGSTIKPDYPNDKRPASEQYYSSVSPLAKTITTWLNNATGGNEYREGAISFSPEILEHLFRSYLGGVGRLAFNTENTISNAIAGKLEAERTPFLRNVYGQTVGEMPTVRAYRKISDAAEALAYEVKSFAESGDRASAISARDRDPVLFRSVEMFRTTNKILRDLRAQEKKIRASNMPDDRRELALDRIAERQHELRRRTIERFDALRKRAAN